MLTTLREAWKRLRGWRRIRFTTGGALFSAGSLAIGFAAVNTGNNLLYLLLGAMLGFIALSGWLSERVLRRLEIRRRTPLGVTVEKPIRITYYVTNRKRLFPTLAVYLFEEGLPEPAFISRVGAGDSVAVCSENHFVHRGVYPLETLTLSTSFPFGLFTKERDVPLPGELVIWPRSDRSAFRHLPEDVAGPSSLTLQEGLRVRAANIGDCESTVSETTQGTSIGEPRPRSGGRRRGSTTWTPPRSYGFVWTREGSPETRPRPPSKSRLRWPRRRTESDANSE